MSDAPLMCASCDPPPPHQALMVVWAGAAALGWLPMAIQAFRKASRSFVVVAVSQAVIPALFTQV